MIELDGRHFVLFDQYAAAVVQMTSQNMTWARPSLLHPWRQELYLPGVVFVIDIHFFDVSAPIDGILRNLSVVSESTE